MTKKVNIRTIERFIERRFQPGPYRLGQREPGTLVFSNPWGRIIGLIDRGEYIALHDTNNKDDQPDNPTLKLIVKGGKLRVLHDKQ